MWTLTVNYSAAGDEGGAYDGRRPQLDNASAAEDNSSDGGSSYYEYFDPCDSLLLDFQAKYRTVYGYLACVLCCVGVLVNATNIVVLTRRQMLSPVNCLLTVVAAAEMGIVGLQLPLAVYFYVLRDERFVASAGQFDAREAPLWYSLVANAGSLLCQTVAAWAMVAVAACRYVSICHHQVGERVCTLRHAKEASAAIVCCSVALLLPNWLTAAVTRVPDLVGFPYCLRLPAVVELSGGGGWWSLGFSSIANDDVSGRQLVAASSWLFATMGKVVPAVLLAVFTCLLVRAMSSIEQRRTTLVNARHRRRSSSSSTGALAAAAATTTAASNGDAVATGAIASKSAAAAAAPSSSSRRSREQRRATRVLLAVVAVWLAVEMPQGVMLAIVCSGHELAYAYEFLGDLINTCTLVAMSVNFFLYTSMMRRFRTTFCQTFLPCVHFGKDGGKLVSGFETSVTYR